jgi:aminoglycoside phosphotransferase (APT) family kinase protein
VASLIESSAHTLARELFGSRLERVDLIPRGVMNHKFKVSLLDGDSYLIRFYPPAQAKIVDYEPDLLGRCFQAGLPTPIVVSDSRSGPAVGHSYLVYRWMHGVSLVDRLPALDPPALERIVLELVSILQRIARLEIAGYGDLVTSTQARFGTWAAFLETTLSELRSSSAATLWGPKTVAALETAWSKSPAWPQERKPVLVLGDISPENILLDAADKIVGLIDLEASFAADFSLTLGYCHARFYNTPFFNALRRVWPREENLDLDQAVQFYTILRGFRLVRFAGTKMPTGHPRDAVENILPGFGEVMKQLRTSC